MLRYNDLMDNFLTISHTVDHTPLSFAFHSHDFYELYFYVSGNVTYYIENETYYLSKGDILIIPPGKLHRTVIGEGGLYDRYVLWLYPNRISEDDGLRALTETAESLANEKNTRLVSYDGHELIFMKELFEKLCEEFREDRPYSYEICRSCVTLILREVCSALSSAPVKAAEREELISRVISRLNADIAAAPSLDELSSEFYISKYHLAHKFREYTGTTVHRYILMKKINTAKELLENGAQTSKVCELCGFSTYSNFYKAFTKITGSSPKKYSLK